jgi:4-aminobutyrate aminotransferase-like enzyme
MKLTKSKLKQLIKEELKVLNEETKTESAMLTENIRLLKKAARAALVCDDDGKVALDYLNNIAKRPGHHQKLVQKTLKKSICPKRKELGCGCEEEL